MTFSCRLASCIAPGISRVALQCRAQLHSCCDAPQCDCCHTVAAAWVWICWCRWFQVGGGKSSCKPASRPRQIQDAESCSDDGTAYQDGMQQSDVELSGEEDGRGGWDECEQEEAEDEHWGPQIATPKAPRHASYIFSIHIYIQSYIL